MQIKFPLKLNSASVQFQSFWSALNYVFPLKQLNRTISFVLFINVFHSLAINQRNIKGLRTLEVFWWNAFETFSRLVNILMANWELAGRRKSGKYARKIRTCNFSFTGWGINKNCRLQLLRVASFNLILISHFDNDPSRK